MKIIYQCTFLLAVIFFAFGPSLMVSADEEKSPSCNFPFPAAMKTATKHWNAKAAADVWLQAASALPKRVGFQQGLLAIPAAPIAVAPNQPPVLPGNTKGIINALCDVPLYILGCGFAANAASITCDTNGDGVADLAIALNNVGVVNRNLVHATIASLVPQLPGTAFPLACCGGTASLTVIQKVSAGDDNIFGGYEIKATCPIELGIRAPVVISASPSSGDCAISQNLQVPGSCFLLPDGSANVTAVFAVEKGNPANVIQATRFVVLTPNLIDALFDLGSANAGKTFLIYASGANGTSRNLTTLPPNAPVGCPLGNEQGLEVSFTCAKAKAPPADPVPPPPTATVNQCRVERSDTGSVSLTISGSRLHPNAVVTIGGVIPKKLKFKHADADHPGFFRTIVVKGRVCASLPGTVIVHNPGENSSPPFACNLSCP
ncbi:MAG: hypothetical protein HY231_21115 [Acidobacteria bacterium]|nr:hypothetical protein [Acidobacteriota bacterium]